MRQLSLFLSLALSVGLGGCGTGGTTGNELPVRCLDKPEPGPCKQRLIRYYYDYPNDRCRPFHYGGCRGHVPFETQDSCEQVCLTGAR